MHSGVIIVDDEYVINEERKLAKGFAVIESEEDGLERNVLLGRRFNWFKR